MENQEVRETLAQIVRQHGQSIAEDPPKLQGLLRDLVGQHRREINILMQAVRVNVPEELLRSSGPTSLTAERLASKLQEDTGLSPDSAQWAVKTWGNAMGITVEFERDPEVADVPAVTERPASISEVPARPQVTTPAPPPVMSNPPVSTPPPVSYPAQQVSQQPPQNWQQPAYSPPPFQAKKGMSGGAIAAIVLVAVVAVGGIAWALTKKTDSVVINNTASPTVTSTLSTATTSPTDTASPTVSDSPSPSPTLTTSPDGVYNDAKGLFSFIPPEGWTMSTDKDGSVQWSDMKNLELQAKMDIRSVPSEGLSLEALIAATEAELKTKMKFHTNSSSDMTLGGERAKLLYGGMDAGAGPKDIGMVMAVHNDLAVVISMGANEGKFTKVAGLLDKSLGTWKWK